MTAYRFVQLSDIHFGQERDGTLVVHDDVRSMLLRDAGELAETRGPAHLVIVVGDTAFAGKEAEYQRAGEWLDQLTRAVKCRETDVSLVPGNHDCDESMISSVTLAVHRDMRQRGAKTAYAGLDDMGKRPEEAHPLLPKLKAYRDFAAGYSSDFQSVGAPRWMRDFGLADGTTLRLVGLNSVQVSEGKDRAGDLILGNTQYILPDEPHLVYIAILHHPLHWFMDEAEAKPYLHSRARVIMVGHEHIPAINKTTDELGNEWLDIYSGATNPPEAGGLYQYVYNWVEISLREKIGSHVLVVNVFPRVWVPAATRFGPDLLRLGGRESYEAEIECRRLRPSSAASKATSRTTATVPLNPGSEEMGEGRDPALGGTLGMDDEPGLAKLKFLFWRHLSWQQRLKVLVQADILPSSAERPVPQTMERLALEKARRDGKLAAVWDAMIAYLPENKKHANPFTKIKK